MYVVMCMYGYMYVYMYIYIYIGVYPKLIPVPTHFFKIIMTVVKPKLNNNNKSIPGEIKIGAFILPNTTNSNTNTKNTNKQFSWKECVISLHELEVLTGIQIFNSKSVLYNVDKVVLPWQYPSYNNTNTSNNNSSSVLLNINEMNIIHPNNKITLLPPPTSPLGQYIESYNNTNNNTNNNISLVYNIYHICHK